MAVQAGEVASLQENEAYRDTIRLLPNGPGTIFGYASADVFAAYGNVLEDLGSIVGSPGGLDATQVSGIGGMAGSFAINEEGLRFDVAQTWDPEFSDQVGGSTRFVSNDSITSRIPGDALGYVAYVVETEDSVWDMIASTYESTYEDQLQLDPIDVMLVNLESEMGVRPGSIERFVRPLGTGFGFYVGGDTVPSDVVVDMTALVMLADPAAAEAALSDLVVPFEGPRAATHPQRLDRPRHRRLRCGRRLPVRDDGYRGHGCAGEPDHPNRHPPCHRTGTGHQAHVRVRRSGEDLRLPAASPRQ